MSDAQGSAQGAGNPDGGQGQQQGQAGQGGQAGQWFDGIGDADLKGYAQAKGWRGVEDAVKSYRDYEKYMGVPREELLRLPKQGAGFDDLLPIFDKLGRPADAKGYEIPVPDGQGGDLAGLFAEWSHKAGLLPAQAKMMAEAWNEYAQQQMGGMQEALAAESAKEFEALKKEWGQEFDKNIELARRASNAMGVSQEQLERIEAAIGTKAMLEMFRKASTGMGELEFVGGDSGGGGMGMSREGAKARIQQLKGDQEFGKRYASGDANARAEMDKLHRIAFSE